ncbi:hypothetical protein CK556_03335 [Mesoplasma chauliocola]|uniref:Uncharacterized protein n=1 Tax=Mesoplasma chauliocola TaxID=216427 RepID=A0A249SPF3_9MOLU|nr:hypothetical protein [Mesoplasma chauliocola]ASZ09361.1 hypothetical protein CK556_03335 [Mesoplasma chauliocola]
MKYFKSICIFILVISGGTTLFFAVKEMQLFKVKENSNELKKVEFTENEWRQFISRNGNIDEDMFKCIFLLKLQSQKFMGNIDFIFEKNKIVIKLSNEFTSYKWYYKLDKE